MRSALPGILVLASLGACRSLDDASDPKLVGGEPAGPGELPAVFVWTSKAADLRESYCTGTKIGRDLILTAGHCVLKQEPRPDEVYVGPWHRLDAFAPGKLLKYSFARALEEAPDGDQSIEIREVLLPPLVEACLAGGTTDAKLCEYRAPIPDVALIRVKADGAFADAPTARVDYGWMGPDAGVTMCGYGAEGVEDRLPRLKRAAVRVSTDAAFLAALSDTDATRDGMPDLAFFFGVESRLAARRHVNLGSGDSGGPVFRTETGEVVGVNSDGFCPLAEPDCEITNNSTFARLSDEPPAAVGPWLRAATTE